MLTPPFGLKEKILLGQVDEVGSGGIVDDPVAGLMRPNGLLEARVAEGVTKQAKLSVVQVRRSAQLRLQFPSR